MAELYSQYESGLQFTAGAINGSALGVSGINPMVDRLNSISSADNLVTGSLISGTSTNIITPYQNGNAWTGSVVSGTSTVVYASESNLGLGSSQNVSFTHMNVGSDWEDVTDASIIISGLTAAQRVLIMASYIGGPDTAGETVYSRLMRDAVALGNIRGVYIIDGTGWLGASHQWIDTPGVGNFEYKLQGKSSDGTGDIEVGDMTSIVLN